MTSFYSLANIKLHQDTSTQFGKYSLPVINAHNHADIIYYNTYIYN